MERGVAVLIPAYQPEARLISLVADLLANRVSAVLVVDDGSGRAWGPVFEALEAMPSVHVLRHTANLGKGRALKTGLRHIWTALPDIGWVVTADADGQHLSDDILRVAEALRSSDRFVIGSRCFDGDVPLRSRLGNSLTRHVFRFASGHDLHDTQSGLRGFPRRLIAELLAVSGERYEYEMNVLAHMCRVGAPPLEVPITTVYLEGNRTSHFRPILDSMRVYFGLLRYPTKSALGRLAGLVRR